MLSHFLPEPRFRRFLRRCAAPFSEPISHSLRLSLEREIVQNLLITSSCAAFPRYASSIRREQARASALPNIQKAKYKETDDGYRSELVSDGDCVVVQEARRRNVPRRQIVSERHELVVLKRTFYHFPTIFVFDVSKRSKEFSPFYSC